MDFLDLAGKINIFYIISQLFALLGTTLSLVAVQQPKKVQLLRVNTIASICQVFHYLFLGGAWTGMETKILAATRNGIATYEASKNRISKMLPTFFVAIYIVIGIVHTLFFRESLINLLPLAAAAVYTVAIYTLNVSRIRKVVFLTSAMWLIYNAIVFSVVGILSEAIFMVDTAVAIYRYRNKSKNKNKKLTKARWQFKG